MNLIDTNNHCKNELLGEKKYYNFEKVQLEKKTPKVQKHNIFTFHDYHLQFAVKIGIG